MVDALFFLLTLFKVKFKYTPFESSWLFFYFLVTKIKNNIKKNDNIVGIVWLAPKPSPVAIHKNKYANSSGSFIGVLNLTIDKAPTNPNESASDDFTIEIIRTIVNVNIIKFFEKFDLFEIEDP